MIKGYGSGNGGNGKNDGWKEVNPQMWVEGEIITHVKESHGMRVRTARLKELLVPREIRVIGDDLNHLRSLIGRPTRSCRRAV